MSEMDAEMLAREMLRAADTEQYWDPPTQRAVHLLPYARALIEAERALEAATIGFGLAYDAVEHGRYDEALLHCGARQAEAGKAVFSLRPLMEKP